MWRNREPHEPLLIANLFPVHFEIESCLPRVQHAANQKRKVSALVHRRISNLIYLR